MRLFSIFPIILLCLFVIGCEKKVTAPAQLAAVQRHELKGKVVEISDLEKKIAKIQHEEIKDFMSAMTMKFPIKDDANFAKLAVGDNITATLIYNPNDNRSWLEGLVITKNTPIPAASANAAPINAPAQ
jgi:Cu/Ag efflux protein CusF